MNRWIKFINSNIVQYVWFFLFYFKFEFCRIYVRGISKGHYGLIQKARLPKLFDVFTLSQPITDIHVFFNPSPRCLFLCTLFGISTLCSPTNIPSKTICGIRLNSGSAAHVRQILRVGHERLSESPSLFFWKIKEERRDVLLKRRAW